MIYQSSGIPALVKVLQCSVDAVVFYAITTIHNLLLHIKESKQNLRQTNGQFLIPYCLVNDPFSDPSDGRSFAEKGEC